MRNKFKGLILAMFVMVLTMIGFNFVSEVKADSVPAAKMTFDYWDAYNLEVADNDGWRIRYAVETNKLAYCLNVEKLLAVSSVQYTRGSVITDPGLAYILSQAGSNSTPEDSYVTQLATWLYLVDTNQSNTNDFVERSRAAAYGEANLNNKYATKVREQLEKAKSLTSYATDVSVKLSSTSLTFTKSSDGKNYVSNTVKVTMTNASSYSVSLSGSSSATVTKTADGFYVTVPVSAVTETISISAKVAVSGKVVRAYRYVPSNSEYQDMAYVVTESLSDSKSIVGSISYVEKTYDLVVRKIDSDSKKSLAGAELVLINKSTNETVSTWVSTVEDKTITGLKAGTYIVKEVKAPDGYELNSKEVIITIKENGKVMDETGTIITEVVIENTKKEVPVVPTFSVVINKLASDTNQFLEGATLCLSKEGSSTNIVCWTTEKAAKTITGLEAGSYVIKETKTPEGYNSISSEGVKFTIDSSGKIGDYEGKIVSEITIVNEKAEVVEVPNTGLSKSSIPYVSGMISIVAGVYLVFREKKKNLV